MSERFCEIVSVFCYLCTFVKRYAYLDVKCDKLFSKVVGVLGGRNMGPQTTHLNLFLNDSNSRCDKPTVRPTGKDVEQGH